jgi:hypothetical protein
MDKLTQDELVKIQELNAEFTKAKIALGEAELSKQAVLKKIDFLREDFSSHEKILIEKYGQDAVINIQTGEVTKKQN